MLNRLDKKQKERLNNIVVVTRIAGIISSGIAVVSLIPIKIPSTLKALQLYLLVVMGFLTLAFLQWIFSFRSLRVWEDPKVRDYLSLLLSVGVITFIVHQAGSIRSGFKFLYAFLVVSNAVQFNIKYGIISAFLSSFGIIVDDLIAMGTQGRNIYLESDIIAIVVFFLTAWISGYFSQQQKTLVYNIMTLGETDNLTGLLNRQVFHAKLVDLVDKANKGVISGSIWIVLLGIRNFKLYNERCGYDKGDQLLKEIKNIIVSCAKDAKFLARHSDNEFGLIFLDISEEYITSIIADIKKSINKYPFYNKYNMPGGDICVYIGMAHYPDDGRTKNELIRAASRDIYKTDSLYSSILERPSAIFDKYDKGFDNEAEHIAGVRMLLSIINNRDHYTYEHTKRVFIYANMIAMALGLPKRQIEIVRYGAYFHDIGKIQAPEALLSKVEELTPQEKEIMKMHSVWGANIIGTIKALAHIAPVVQYHHERWDGKGYPFGLKQEDIPLEARIVALADGFDIISKGVIDMEKIDLLLRYGGTLFDPQLACMLAELLQLDHMVM